MRRHSKSPIAMKFAAQAQMHSKSSSPMRSKGITKLIALLYRKTLGLFETNDNQQEKAFRKAIEMINTDESKLPNTKLQAKVKTVAPQDSFRALKTEHLRGTPELMGGALVILSGDLRQKLRLIPKLTPTDKIHHKAGEFIWPLVKKVQLRTNMRVLLSNNEEKRHSAKNFYKLVKTIPNLTGQIERTNDLCNIVNSSEKLID
ncbi:hypothetical protein CEXT_668011 [Caerostris extrusa]|uniref:ATP-dependent DNA helicase n=1 Tax=Caerostris extrusa TaxID=172846 RepID=A0AAV4U6H3_CAEEX|nr:hypothetical protein CEXT_668011 [Caerostris extrusa]